MDLLTKELEVSSFFKSLEEFEESKGLPLQGYEKVIAREFSRIFMIYWINGKESLLAYLRQSNNFWATKKEGSEESEISAKGQKLVEFLDLKDWTESDFRYKSVGEIF